MGTEPELVLAGRRCVPRRFLEQGFSFEHQRLDAALQGLLAKV
jgi:NAD dependent epimerase/dehydratase family enzyme